MQVINIESDGIIDIIHVIDLQGRTLKETILNEEMIDMDVSGLLPGIYIIKILSNNHYYTYKFLKPY